MKLRSFLSLHPTQSFPSFSSSSFSSSDEFFLSIFDGGGERRKRDEKVFFSFSLESLEIRTKKIFSRDSWIGGMTRNRPFLVLTFFGGGWGGIKNFFSIDLSVLQGFAFFLSPLSSSKNTHLHPLSIKTGGILPTFGGKHEGLFFSLSSRQSH